MLMLVLHLLELWDRQVGPQLGLLTSRAPHQDGPILQLIHGAFHGTLDWTFVPFA